MSYFKTDSQGTQFSINKHIHVHVLCTAEATSE